MARQQLFPFVPGERTAALQVLRDWIASGRRMPVEWVLGTSEVRYLVLPWSPDLVDERLRDAFAHALFEQQFRHDPMPYALQFATPVFGMPQLVAFVARDLLAEIEVLARASRCRVASIAPALATVWHRFHPVLRQEHGAVCLVDDDRQVIVRHDNGHITEVSLRPFGAGSLAALAAGGDTLRVVASVPLDAAALPAGALLTLEAGHQDSLTGVAAASHNAYAFALCGVF